MAETAPSLTAADWKDPVQTGMGVDDEAQIFKGLLFWSCGRRKKRGERVWYRALTEIQGVTENENPNFMDVAHVTVCSFCLSFSTPLPLFPITIRQIL